MSISQNQSVIDSSVRDELLGKSLDGTSTQASTTTGGVNIAGHQIGAKTEKSAASVNSVSGQQLAGITADFAKEVTTAIEEYIETINTELNKLETAVERGNQVLRGEQIIAALNNFLTGCKEVAQSYTNKLKEAEETIINSVQTVYESQDESIASDLNTDTTNMSSQGFGG